MSRITYDQLAGLPDPQNTEWFELLLGSIPGGGDTQELTLLCQTASWPGMSITPTEVPLHGFTLKGGGRRDYPRTLSVAYQEVSTMVVTRKLRNWMERIRGTRNGLSQGYKKDWSVNAKLIVYDTTGLVVDSIIFRKLFIQDLPDIGLDGSSSTAMQISATFSYDIHESEFVQSL
jgi:hypothetical protein